MLIDYQLLVEDSMLSIVKKVLANIANDGITNEQSFYISFRTDFPDVMISSTIKKRYPKEITIVLQYQFRDLIVSDNKFSVNIAFNGISETIEVPFAALTSFIDPLANFSLQLKQFENNINFIDIEHNGIKNLKEIKKQNKTVVSKNLKETQKLGEVISIDKFLKKRK